MMAMNYPRSGMKPFSCFVVTENGHAGLFSSVAAPAQSTFKLDALLVMDEQRGSDHPIRHGDWRPSPWQGVSVSERIHQFLSSRTLSSPSQRF